jgi:hypothetical protein
MRANLLNYGEVIIEGGASPSLTLTGRDQQGIAVYSERIESGVGSLRIESSEPRPFETSGAHVFRGMSPAVIPYASAGEYSLRWTDTDEVGASGMLASGQELVLS